MGTITPGLISSLRIGWTATFNKSFEGAQTSYQRIAMVDQLYLDEGRV